MPDRRRDQLQTKEVKFACHSKSEYSLEKIIWKLKQTKHETQMQM